MGIYKNNIYFKILIEEIDGKTETQAHALLSSLDTTYLLSYAVFMFLAGMIADRLDLRYFLAGGMIGSGVITILFGMGKYWGIHSLYYYNIIQVKYFSSKLTNPISEFNYLSTNLFFYL